MMHTVAVVVLSCLLLVCSLHGPGNACTSFLMDTPDGPVFGCNLDLFIPGDGLVLVNRRGISKESCRPGTTGETAKWISEYGSVTFSLVGREYAWSGMNEAGLVVSSMELKAGEHPEPDERPPVYDGRWTQYVLDTCGSVEEAIQTGSLVRVEDSVPTSHYLVADAEGNCAVIEYLDGEFVYYTGEDLPLRALANGPYARALKAYERGGPPWWWSNPGRSAERVAAAHERSVSFDATGDTPAVNHAFGTLVYWVAAPHTRWNIVYDVAGGEVWYRSDQSSTYKHISLGAFDFSCDAPLLMLDMNAALEGDVEDFFTPYDHDVNLDVFRTFCDRYGIEVSEEGSANLMQFFEGFECAR